MTDATDQPTPTASPSAAEHRAKADATAPAVGVGWVTVSDTRTRETDKSGDLAEELLTAAGHTIIERHIVKDEPIQIRSVLLGLLASDNVQAVLLSGGTSVAQRDSTVDVVEPMFEKPMPGFGEIFRVLSWEEVGPPAILSRATAGILHGKPVFCLPGSKNAVGLAIEKIIAPELKHLIWETLR
jgi:molybdenum cofactor biosynthesis protein B